jgi:hypothetical protein
MFPKRNALSGWIKGSANKLANPYINTFSNIPQGKLVALWRKEL